MTAVPFLPLGPPQKAGRDRTPTPAPYVLREQFALARLQLHPERHQPFRPRVPLKAAPNHLSTAGPNRGPGRQVSGLSASAVGWGHPPHSTTVSTRSSSSAAASSAATTWLPAGPEPCAFRRELPTPIERHALVDQLIIELVRHSVAEEKYLYPVVRRVLPDGDTLADRALEEHTAAEELMNALDGAHHFDAAQLDTAARALMTRVYRHFQDEEAVVFPRLRAALSAQEHKLLAPGTALVDRVCDWLSGRTT
ncbi:hemerythrin domain-containing protein [Streptomyces sp. NPDC052236]|uniref:hemerythrin domain-containing protein n=1 Tax=Streptomyces sp. NPDC052236 TaxID=3365686 RepID=UPI0037D7A280